MCCNAFFDSSLSALCELQCTVISEMGNVYIFPINDRGMVERTQQLCHLRMSHPTSHDFFSISANIVANVIKCGSELIRQFFSLNFHFPRSSLLINSSLLPDMN